MANELTAGRMVSEQRDARTRETPTQRWNRNYLEILHEVRAAQIGTQLLLVFLLLLAFTGRFAETTQFQRTVYVVSLVLVAGATCLLIAPAPFSRLVFRRRLEAQLVRASSRFAFWGVTMLMLAINGVVLLILDVVMGAPYAYWITGGSLAWFLIWWYVAPGWVRAGQRKRRKEATVVALEAASQKLHSERVRDGEAAPRALGSGARPAGALGSAEGAVGTAGVVGSTAPVSSVPVSSPLGAALGGGRGRPGPHPPQLRPGPTWPAPRLPMMPTPHPSLATGDQLGYPGGHAPAVGFDRPSPQPGAATGPNGRYPMGPRPAGGPNGARNGRNGPVPVGYPGPTSGPAGALGGPRSGTDGPIGGGVPNGTGPVPINGGPLHGGPLHGGGPIHGGPMYGGPRYGGPIYPAPPSEPGRPAGAYAAVDPLGPIAVGGLAVPPFDHPVPPYDSSGPVNPMQYDAPGASRPISSMPVSSTPFDGAAARGPRHPYGPLVPGSAGPVAPGTAEPGAPGRASAGRHRGISLTDLPITHTTGDVPLMYGTGDIPRLSGDGMQHGRSGDGMQNGSGGDGVTQFGVAIPTAPAPSGLPASGGGAVPTPAGASGSAAAGPAAAGPAPAGPFPSETSEASEASVPDEAGERLVSDLDGETGATTDADGQGVVGRARVTPPNAVTSRHGYPTPAEE
ncbi:DUF6328 family protein [Cryptosporangium sp. NPDC051539]|uniref:DUF6328 family protein n=1 Tax=Cryptosporangium sp. NPDC051539 TaxID=3363962 RepID=UPI0037BA1631